MPRFLMVEAPYYTDIAVFLRQGALRVLEKLNVDYDILQVPGALEIAPAINFAAQSEQKEKVDAFIALGCVIRGATSHYNIVCEQSASGITHLALNNNIAIGNGILTCENYTQALERADPSQKDHGGQAARAAFSLFNIKKEGLQHT